MAVAVSVIVLAALVLLVAVIVHVVRKTLRWLNKAPIIPSTRSVRAPGQPASDSSATPPAFGRLPTPADPVGPLGSLSPDADLSSPSMSEGDLIGE